MFHVAEGGRKLTNDVGRSPESFGMKSEVTRDGDVAFLSYCEAREDVKDGVANAESSVECFQ